MESNEIGTKRALANNFYAIRMLWSISKSRVVHMVFLVFIDILSWMFYATFFMRYLVHAIETEQSFETIFMFIMFSFAVFSILHIYNSYIYNVVFGLTDIKINQGLYSKLYKKARSVELRCFEDAEFYNKYTMALDNAAGKITEMVQNFYWVIFGIIAGFYTFYVMFSIDHMAIIFLVFPMIGNFIFGRAMNKLYTKRYMDNVTFERKSEYVNRVMYLSDYAKEVRLSNIFRLMMRKQEEATKGSVSVAQKHSAKSIVNNWIQNVLTFAFVFEGIMLYSAYRTMITKSMGLAELAIMFSIMTTSSWIVFQLFQKLVDVIKNGLFMEYLRSFLEYKEVISEDQDGRIPDKVIQSIEFKDVTFYYKEEEPLIEHLSLRVEGNQTIALAGHNGAGKSTLLKLLFRLYDPVKGDILLNGINIKDYNVKAYRSLFASAFQDYKVFGLSIRENILMGRQVEDEENVVKDCLERAGILEKVMSLPNGIDTILTKEFNDEGAVLSGGQYQKIVVARAFAHDGPIKVFDEPSSALDPIAEYQMYQSIKKESRDKMMFFISHRLSSVKDADIVYMMENGSIIEQGTHQELMKAQGAYADMYQKQAKNYLAIEDGEQLKEVIA